ncbi:hypothetical protein ACU686_09940 [Yinghuangia aomiensis]
MAQPLQILEVLNFGPDAEQLIAVLELQDEFDLVTNEAELFGGWHHAPTAGALQTRQHMGCGAQPRRDDRLGGAAVTSLLQRPACRPGELERQDLLVVPVAAAGRLYSLQLKVEHLPVRGPVCRVRVKSPPQQRQDGRRDVGLAERPCDVWVVPQLPAGDALQKRRRQTVDVESGRAARGQVRRCPGALVIPATVASVAPAS